MAATNVQAFSGDVTIPGDVTVTGETILGTATYRKRRDWNRVEKAYVYLGNVRTSSTTGIRLDVSLNNSNSGYIMNSFQITLAAADGDHSGGQLVYSVVGLHNAPTLSSIDIGYVYVSDGTGLYTYQLWLKDPVAAPNNNPNLTGTMDAYLNCQGYYIFDTGVSDVAHGGSAPTNFNVGVPGVVCDVFGNVGIGINAPPSQLTVASTINSLDATDSATFDKYTVVIANNMASGADDKEMGLSFVSLNDALPTNVRTPGAAITHERTGGWSKGKLHFKTKGGTNSDSACTTRMTIDDTGKVGIGTDAPKAILSVKGEFLSQDVASTYFSHNLYYDTAWKYASDSHGGALMRINNSQIEFWNVPNGGGADAAATMSQRMTIVVGGNVGIGASNPQNKLAVAGNVTFGAGATTTTTAYHAGMLNVIGGGTRALLRIENNSSIGSPGIIFGEGGVFTEDTVPTIKKVQGTNNLAIMTGGNVGFGLTTPTSSVHIAGTTFQQYNTKEFHQNWGGNNVRRFSIPAYGNSAKGSYTVECEAMSAASNGSGIKKSTVKGVIFPYGIGNHFIQVDESLNAYSFKVYQVCTNNSAAGTLRIEYRPDAGYQQNVNTTMYIKLRYAASSTGFGAVTQADQGSNFALTTPIYSDRGIGLARFAYIGGLGGLQTFSGTTAESTFDNSDQVFLTSIGPGAGIIMMEADFNGYDRTGSRVYTYAAAKNVSGGNMAIDADVQSSWISSTSNFFPQIFFTATAGAAASLYIRSTGSYAGANVTWKVALYRIV
jgi:hypothetical protein